MLISKSPWAFSCQYETFYWKEKWGSKSSTHLADKSPCDLPLGHSAESGWTVSAHRWRQRRCHGLAGVGPQAALCLPRLWCWNPIHGPVLWPKVRAKSGLDESFGEYIFTIKLLIPDLHVKNRTVGIVAQRNSLHTSIDLLKQRVILSSRKVILFTYSMTLFEDFSYWRWPVKIFTAVSHHTFQCNSTWKCFSAFITKIWFVYKMDVSHFICTPLAFRLGFYLLWCVY